MYSRDFILGDTPLNKCANLFLLSGDSSSLSLFWINTKKITMIIMAIQAIREINEITKEIILFTPEILKWYISETHDTRMYWFVFNIILIYIAKANRIISLLRIQWAIIKINSQQINLLFFVKNFWNNATPK